MLLFTITPALAMTSMPVITTPKGCPMTNSPSSTPKVESTTAVSTRPTEVSLLNCASRIAKMRKIAVPNALSRNADALARSSSSPLSLNITPAPRSVCASARDLRLHRGALHAFGEVGGDGHHPAAVDAIDVADALRRHALREVADRHMPHLGLHAQVVDLVEAAPFGRKAHQDVHRLVAVDRPVFGRLEAVGDELDRAADGVDAGAVLRRLRLVDLELPVDAGKRLAVIEIADVATRGQDGRDLAGGRLRQSANSNRMTPMVSSVSSLMPRGCSPMRV